jgi:two-component system, OmpR family, alkaline phosphatase synthesis response regulator PhoP
MTDATFTPHISHALAPLVTIVDDDRDILELVSLHLSKSGMKVREFADAEGFYRFLQYHVPDLIILDLMLPDTDGLEICRFLRKEDRFSHIPVIMVTAKADELDKVLGLEMGADDYVTKPFSPKELVARVKAVLRRTKSLPEKVDVIKIGEFITIDPGKYELSNASGKVDVTTVEFRILQLLASKPGRVFSRETILNHLWGNEKAVTDRTIDVHIRHLREKLGPAASLIKNIRGVGYKLEL